MTKTIKMQTWEEVQKITEVIALIEDLRNLTEDQEEAVKTSHPHRLQAYNNWLSQGEVIRQSLLNQLLKETAKTEEEKIKGAALVPGDNFFKAGVKGVCFCCQEDKDLNYAYVTKEGNLLTAQCADCVAAAHERVNY